MCPVRNVTYVSGRSRIHRPSLVRSTLRHMQRMM
jgi:hypothetical protein